MKPKTFLLGLGAPRCGTTWLFKFLSTYPEINFGFKKEYHVFDSVYCEPFHYFSAKNVQQKTDSNITNFEKKFYDELEQLACMECDHSNYFAYFANLLTDEKIVMTGDITPTYCALPQAILQLIKENLTKRGIAVKALFIMRDPVEKMASEARLTVKFKKIHGKKIVHPISPSEVLTQYHNRPILTSTTQYRAIIRQLTSVFTTEELYLGLYETMHTSAEIQRLCNFLNIQPRYDLMTTKVNSTVHISDADISDDLRKSIFLAHQSEYQFCQTLFPSVKLDELWKKY